MKIFAEKNYLNFTLLIPAQTVWELQFAIIANLLVLVHLWLSEILGVVVFEWCLLVR